MYFKNNSMRKTGENMKQPSCQTAVYAL